MKLIIHQKSKGTTDMRVIAEVSDLVYAWTSPMPFGLEPIVPIPLSMVYRIEGVCKAATAKTRVGMMNTSSYEVKLEEGNINCYKVRNTKKNTLLFTLQLDS